MTDRSHIVELPFWSLIIRGAQCVLGVIVLGLAAAELSISNSYADDWNGRFGWSLFVGLITLIITAWYLVSYLAAPVAYNKFAVLALDAFLVFCWLVVWALMADYTKKYTDATSYSSGGSSSVSSSGGKYCATVNGQKYCVNYKAKRMTYEDAANIIYALLALGLVEWILFIVSLVFFVLAFLKHRQTAATSAPVVSDKPVEQYPMGAQPAQPYGQPQYPQQTGSPIPQQPYAQYPPQQYAQQPVQTA